MPFPEAEAWSAVVDGREVAVAVVEQHDNGTWVSHDVRVCGKPVPSTVPTATDG